MNREMCTAFVLGSIFSYGIYTPSPSPIPKVLSLLSFAVVYQKATVKQWILDVEEDAASPNSAASLLYASIILAETLIYLALGRPFKYFFVIIYRIGSFISIIATILVVISLYILSKEDVKKCVFIDRGIYVYIRHPYYLGVCLMFVGCNMMLGNVVSLAIVSASLYGRISEFIRKEEELLTVRNTNYSKYIKSVWSGFPLMPEAKCPAE